MYTVPYVSIKLRNQVIRDSCVRQTFYFSILVSILAQRDAVVTEGFIQKLALVFILKKFKFKWIQIWMWVHTSENYFGWEPHLCFKTDDLTKVTYICGSQTGVLLGFVSVLSRGPINKEHVHFFTVLSTVD